MSLTPPAHWSPHTGPNQWFTLWHPRSWQVEETAAGTRLTPPGDAGTLTIQGIWIEGDRRLPLPKLLDFKDVFRRLRRVRELKSPEIGEESVARTGEAVVGHNVSWLQRLLERPVWRRWWAWGAVQHQVHLVGLYLAPESPDPETATIAGMILQSLQFRDCPACPPEVFLRIVQDLVRREFPKLESEVLPGFKIRLGGTHINLHNFYRSYLNAPNQLEQVLLPALNTIHEVQEWDHRRTDPELDTVADRIMPMLYPEQVWRTQFPDLVATPWIADLVVLYVVDESHAYWFISQKLTEGWNLTTDELHSRALVNLHRYFDQHPMQFSFAGQDDGPRLVMPARPDAYNAVRLISETFLQRLREVLATPFAVGIPSRDFLVGVSLHSPEAVAHVRRRVEDDFRVKDHPLCSRLLLVTQDGVTELLDP